MRIINIESKKEFLISFLILFVFFHLFALYNGYPYIGLDSQRIFVALRDVYTPFALTTSGVLYKPFYYFFNNYFGVFFLQALITSYVFARLKTDLLASTPLWLFLLAVLLSMQWQIVLYVLYDFYTVVGLISIFLILEKKEDFSISILLLIACCAHFSHFIIYFSVVAIYSLLMKKRTKLILISFIFVASFLMNGLYAYFIAGKFIIASRVSYSFFAARIINDKPKSVFHYAGRRPNSFIAKNKVKLYNLGYYAKSWSSYALLWADVSPLKGHIYTPYTKEFYAQDRSRGRSIKVLYNNELKEFVMFTIKRKPVEHIYLAIENFFNRIWVMNLTNTYMRYVAHGENVVRKIDKSNLQKTEGSVACKKFRGKSFKQVTAAPILNFTYKTSLILTLVFLLFRFFDGFIFRFLSFSLMSVFINTFITTFVSGTTSRYLHRSIFILVLAAMVALYALIKRALDKNRNKI